jgi:hypothetical protein
LPRKVAAKFSTEINEKLCGWNLEWRLHAHKMDLHAWSGLSFGICQDQWLEFSPLLEASLYTGTEFITCNTLMLKIIIRTFTRMEYICFFKFMLISALALLQEMRRPARRQ